MELNPHFQAFYNRLKKVYTATIGKQAKQLGITCYRLYDKDMPEHPLIIDVYENNVVVYEYESNHKLTDDEYEQWGTTCLAIISEILKLPLENIFLKIRKRKKGRDDQYEKIAEEKTYQIVNENGIQFYVNLHDFLDTGLFLDHRPTRKMMSQHVANQNVLNLFCYTGSFSLYAAKANAKEVWSLDLSNTYIDWGKNNEELNQFTTATKMVWQKCDVLQAVKQLPLNFFHTIILDPPTFSNSKMMKSYWDVQEHHAYLLHDLAPCLQQGGKIYFSTNATKFALDARLETHWNITDITAKTTDFDFKGKLRRACFLLEKR